MAEQGQISKFIIGICIFVFIITAGMTMISTVATENPAITNDPRYSVYNTSFNKLQNISDMSDSIQESITDASTDFGVFGVINSLINSAWHSLKLTFNSITFFTDSLQSLTSLFGIPSFVIVIITSIITIMIGFGIYSLIFQRNP